VVAEPEPEPQLAQAPEEAEEPTFTVSPWPRTADVVTADPTVPRDGRGSPDGDGAADDGAVSGRSAGRGDGPILIRGGVSRRDPCAIHMPGRGGIAIAIGGIILGGGSVRDLLGPASVLIHERAPRNPVFAPASAGDSRPVGTRRTSAGGSRLVSRRGSLR
jgi:hypothetical protein